MPFNIDFFDLGSLIILALVGYILYFFYNRWHYRGLPPTYSSDLEAIFYYISIAVIGAIIAFVYLFLPLVDKLFIPILSLFLEAKVINEIIATQFVNYSIIAFIFSIFLFIAFFVAYLIGLITFKTNKRWINVTFSNGEQKIYPRIICESKEFIYFEKVEQFGLWICHDKNDISRIETIDHPSRFNTWLNDSLINLYITHFLEDRIKRELTFGIIMLTLIILTTIVA